VDVSNVGSLVRDSAVVMDQDTPSPLGHDTHDGAVGGGSMLGKLAQDSHSGEPVAGIRHAGNNLSESEAKRDILSPSPKRKPIDRGDAGKIPPDWEDAVVTCPLGWHTLGLYLQDYSAGDVCSVVSASRMKLLATGDVYGNVSLWHFPCAAKVCFLLFVCVCVCMWLLYFIICLIMELYFPFSLHEYIFTYVHAYTSPQ
jgi:hypothetical protein